MTGAGAGRTKNLENWQILVDIYSWERSWKAGIILILNCPKFPNFGKAENFFQNVKNLKSWKILAGLKFVEKELVNLTYQKKAPFSHH